MPVVFTYDLAGAESAEHNRIQSAFERLGWQNLGGSSYRYPKLGTHDQPVEDWFNHIIPALMLFRCYVVSSDSRNVSKFTLDVQSSSGFNPNESFGTPPQSSSGVKFYEPTNQQFGLRNLQNWLDSISFPY